MNQAIYFEDVAVSDKIPAREFGPLTIVDTVRWAGLQENWQHLHFDRDHVREHNGLKTFIASGAYRQALLMRMLTDWIGPRGRLRKISIRHTHSTFEGDLMRFSATITKKSIDPSDPRVMYLRQSRRLEW
jgi:acyl dehydratase